MTHEASREPSGTVFEAITNKFTAAAERDMHDSTSQLLESTPKHGEVVTLQQAVDPGLKIVLSRADVDTEVHPVAVLSIDYAVMPSEELLGPEPEEQEPVIIHRLFWTYGDGKVTEASQELLSDPPSTYRRELGEGEKEDILSLVENATLG